ncbi:glycerate kinase family protein [Rhodococcus sp. BH5]|uniref:glycerate kinase family protein n=1 Tax=Rhodococcus sp. BH5 TaxID=2871702 RepID=UPI0022CD396C|nr:glycerate kinase [Rhodococcus sp. BH5]MCZ9635126.1 glycerate kinase [Rhodococcus sp. BH5]
MSYRVPQRILIAPSGFKESLCVEAVAAAIAAGVRRALPGVRVDIAPIADGGEGTARTLAAATNGTLHDVAVIGPTGATVNAHWALLGVPGKKIALVEMAAAAGLSLVPENQRDPGSTTTYGVGQLIAAALDHHVDTILVGCGDSGTCDGGAGALQALGAKITDSDGCEINFGGRELARARRLDLSGIHYRLAATEIILACNQHNVLAGAHGVARVFGPQKGATSALVDELDAALSNWATILECDGVHSGNLRTGAGTGASGGLGAGLAGGAGAQLRSRFDVLLDSGLCGIDLDRRISKADLVITAEGAIDFQTPHGKVPAEVARRANRLGVPVVALAGSLGQGAPTVHDMGIAAIASILTVPMSLSQAMADGEALLIDAAERMMRMILIGGAISAKPGSKRGKAS